MGKEKYFCWSISSWNGRAAEDCSVDLCLIAGHERGGCRRSADTTLGTFIHSSSVEHRIYGLTLRILECAEPCRTRREDAQRILGEPNSKSRVPRCQKRCDE